MRSQDLSPGDNDRSAAGEADDLRAEHRKQLDAQVGIRILGGRLSARSENASEAGILLVTEEALEVSIEFEGASGLETRSGRIVRMQRMGVSSTGIAVEFNPA